ncbi:glycosyltransferase [Pontimicrobium sp. SW4]|uniref:Glycosyltransferase n=1 Tax=Pontimicrobium sp. SW4 TaxID=3153519 RepID=A0AAU7BTG4_9FLAO
MIFIILITTILYCLLIGFFVIGFNRVKSFEEPFLRNLTRFTIVVPFRNEEENLPDLIKSLESLNYSKNHFEVLFVDDDSTDNSVELCSRLLSCSQLDFKIIKNKRSSNSPKKDAITTAINNAKYYWIATTDADCEVPNRWLETSNSFINSYDVAMIVAPVTYTSSDSFLKQFQTLDVLSLQAVTIAGFGLSLPFLCNGANLFYRKDLFEELNGFDNNNDIASGDDIFLLEKAVKKYPKLVKYLKSTNAIIFTKAETSLSALIQQRIRWTAKTSTYKNTFGKFVGILVLTMNSLVVTTLFLSIFGLFSWLYFTIFLTSKLAMDYLLLSKSTRFFNQTNLLNNYFFSGLLYPFFTVFVAFKAMFSKYKWKGRSFKK